MKPRGDGGAADGKMPAQLGSCAGIALPAIRGQSCLPQCLKGLGGTPRAARVGATAPRKRRAA
ncbi:hypothetical protein RKD28_005972 [Streptomyces sp. SAI-229]